MAKQARERAVREKRALKEERKRERKLGLADETDPADLPADLNDPGHHVEPGLRLVAEDESVTDAAAGTEAAAERPEPASADEDQLRGAHA